MNSFSQTLTYILLPIILLAVFWFEYLPFLDRSLISSAATAIPSITLIPTPPVGSPRQISIEKLGLTTIVQPVTLTADGRMDIPSDPKNVGWYSLGPKPGEIGNSVIDGHYDDLAGASIFYHLDKLAAGDNISVISSDGRKYIFKVISTQIYPDASFPLDLVFGSANEKNLNLITCAGFYDWQEKDYLDRLVIFTRLIKVE